MRRLLEQEKIFNRHRYLYREGSRCEAIAPSGGVFGDRLAKIQTASSL
ncbi:MAG TPA: hypothetical protein V6D30_07475 [Leptolyngbyaceae cyanobacterium]